MWGVGGRGQGAWGGGLDKRATVAHQPIRTRAVSEDRIMNSRCRDKPPNRCFLPFPRRVACGRMSEMGDSSTYGKAINAMNQACK